MRAGFIGTGSMGSILIEAFIHSGVFSPEEIHASNRTFSKVERLAEVYPGLNAVRSNIEAVLDSDFIFLCVKPGEFKNVLEEIKTFVKPTQIVISITSPILIKHLESQLSAKISKIIPSITNYVWSGATLCIHGTRMLSKDKEILENLLAPISAPIRVSENHTRICSDISSCGPAFLAYFIQQFIQASVEETGISEEQATQLASEMTLGTGKLLTTGGFTPTTLQKRVSVPGGITAEGLRIMEESMEGMFIRLIQATHAKYEEDIEKSETLFATKQ
ncbi:Pyrroline-5-carboxylate reductase [compost metagenome]